MRDGNEAIENNPKPKVRPIQMGEGLRKWVSKRLLKLNGGDINKTMIAMRQLGVGIPGGAEALALFEQLLFDAWSDGRLSAPLARIKIDEKNCFVRWSGMKFEKLRYRPCLDIVQSQLGSTPDHHLCNKMA